MASERRGNVSRAAVAVVLLLIGLAAWGLWRVLSGSENLPYTDGAAGAPSAHVTRGNTYSLAVPGGIAAMQARGVPIRNTGSSDVISLDCTWTSGGSAVSAPEVQPESSDSKAENTVGRFQAPVTGMLRVTCSGWGAMYIPDSDNRTADLSGWALIIAVVALSIGAPLGLSALRNSVERQRALRASDEQDEVQGYVDVALGSRDDREVGRLDRDDVVE